MDQTLYRIILSQHPDLTPDLAIVQEKQPVPESWPLLLESIKTQSHRFKDKHFVVTDGSHSVVCQSGSPGLYDRIAALEVGNVVHLIGATPVFSDAHNAFTLDVEQVLTLKAYDDHLRQQKREEEERRAQLMDEGFFDTFKDVVYVSKNTHTEMVHS